VQIHYNKAQGCSASGNVLKNFAGLPNTPIQGHSMQKLHTATMHALFVYHSVLIFIELAEARGAVLQLQQQIEKQQRECMY